MFFRILPQLVEEEVACPSCSEKVEKGVGEASPNIINPKQSHSSSKNNTCKTYGNPCNRAIYQLPPWEVSVKIFFMDREEVKYQRSRMDGLCRKWS